MRPKSTAKFFKRFANRPDKLIDNVLAEMQSLFCANRKKTLN
jgi:hypothetical protein